jgi:tetratricopeptide (TPR) repeat protein
MRRVALSLLVFIPLCLALAALAYNLPPIHERLAWRVDGWRSEIKYALNPPEQVVFVPQEQVEQLVQATLAALTPTQTAAPSLTPTSFPTNPGPTPTAPPTETATPVPTPLPESVRLSGIRHEYQKWNNCGPATLSMALSFWNWMGGQDEAAAFTKPNPRDKNVMPYEMAAFVEERTGLKAAVRAGGNLDTLKRLIAAGFPVLVEKGFEGDQFDGWMGHYGLLNGYDEARQQFWVYDSYVGPDHDFRIDYEEIASNWRAFNFLYLVIYPAERQDEVMDLLGRQADEIASYQEAAQIASDEIYSLSGRDQYFAWFNRGSSLVKLQDYAGAAAAYDEAFKLYPSIPEKQRPWRMLWYQTGPYFAYFYSGRYYDVISLATTTIDNASEPAIEESFYWRAMARAALGDNGGAIEDFNTSLQWHPGFGPTLYQLELLGTNP